MVLGGGGEGGCLGSRKEWQRKALPIAAENPCGKDSPGMHDASCDACCDGHVCHVRSTLVLSLWKLTNHRSTLAPQY